MQRPTLLLKNTTLTWVMRIYDSSDALVDADSTPTVAVRKNGSSTGDSVTVTKRSATTGIYDCSYNPASEVEGDQFTIEETATVASTTTSWNWSFIVLDSDVTGKVLGGGSGTISGTGARVVDGDGSAIATADSIAALFTTAMTEAYPTDGSTVTPAQALYLILAHLNERTVSGTTITLKKLDGSTTAATFTTNDANTPTSITRAS